MTKSWQIKESEPHRQDSGSAELLLLYVIEDSTKQTEVTLSVQSLGEGGGGFRAKLNMVAVGSNIREPDFR